MKNVEQSRDALNRYLDHALKRFRSWLSMKDGNTLEVDVLHESDGELRAKLMEVVLAHLGHVTAISANGKNGYDSKARRAAAKL